MRIFLSFALLALALALRPGTARAADPAADGRLRDALRSTTAQLRVLEEEKSKWVAKDAEARKELEALKSELAAAKKGAARKGEDRALKQRLAAQEETGTKAAEALERCQKGAAAAADAAAAQAKEREEASAETAGKLDVLAKRFSTCETKNARLAAAGKQFLDWIASEGGMICEPLLGFRRVELEKKAQEFEDQLLDNQAAR